uniref:Ion_trans_2 domain-containing protein n=1 Tax=Caenorhabditis tropicalis TaxID=1561998 RepID=A0A1I7TZI0_9PELO
MEVPTVILHSPDTDSVISDNDSSYYFDDQNSMERLALRNQEYSDDRSMQRRNPIRRQRTQLDDEQTKDAMKLLEKFVRRKYPNFNQESVDIEQAATPVGTQSAYQFSRNLTPAERLSCVFSSSPLGPVPADSHFPPVSPPLHETTFRSEIKHRERESWGSWFVRVGKFLYQFLGLQYIILALVILGYACLGGYIFQTLEHDQQLLDLEEEQRVKVEESTILAKHLLGYLKKWNCGQSNEKKCLELITKAFIERSDKVEKGIRGDGWRWDFWNSVFFAATIFTTIGYGNLACKTSIGRIATIIYGLIGIPLMLFVLKVFGELSINWVQKIRYTIRRSVRRCIRNNLKRASTIESVASDEMVHEDSERSDDEERITTFPVKWALFIVFLFMMVCSFIVSFWEKWDFLTAFYFFFVSLSTIGFGDVIPEHPRTACGLFILYFVGLALFSMVYAILQERVENQYMWALELIDQEYQESQKLELEAEEPAEKPSENGGGGGGTRQFLGWGDAIGKMNSQNSIRWRQKNSAYSMENMPDRPMSERRFSVFTPGEAPQAPPPVLGTFMLHNLSMKKKLLARSESILNQQGTKRPSTLFPSNEMLSNSANSSRGSPWPHAAEMSQPKEPTTLGKSIGISAPNLTTAGGQGNRSPSGALSVITEASDEDTRHFKKHRKQLTKTVATDETVSNHGSAESLDQVMDELQLEAHDQSITPKPYRDPTTAKYRKRDETAASRAEKMPLSPRYPLKEEDEEDSES